MMKNNIDKDNFDIEPHSVGWEPGPLSQSSTLLNRITLSSEAHPPGETRTPTQITDHPQMFHKFLPPATKHFNDITL